MDAPGFAPNQAMPFSQKMFETIGADETPTIAKFEMSLLPPSQVTPSSTTPPAVSAPSPRPFTHVFLSFGLPILDDPVRAAKEMYRTLRPGGTAVTAFWLQIPQGECAGETRRAVYGADARLAVEPKPQHKDRDYIRGLLVEGGFRFEDVQLHEKSAFLSVQSLDESALAIWSAIGVPPGGWTQNDEDTWDAAVAKYKELDSHVVPEWIRSQFLSSRPELMTTPSDEETALRLAITLLVI
ncbi:hypothetical protein PG991_005438 [Apiospora marii]|uniref:Methyltransferase type 11 domain-containing protein n=1 Tax=Apiospora marii TaxID=335849 RepID=A0ABR1S963_9PEZI